MKTPIFSCLKTTFAIIGTVIGAGFISGREIITFFYGQNVVLSIFVIFILFFIGFYILLSIKNLPDKTIIKIFEPIILFSNLIIMSGMLSSIDEIFFEMLSLSKKLPFFSILALILSNIIISKGIDGLKIANSILVPIIVIFTTVILFYKNTFEFQIISNFSILKLLCYMGVNTFTSSTVFIDLGKNLSKKQVIISSVTSSLILCFLIIIIFLSLNYNSTVIRSAIPMMEYLKSNNFLLKSFSILMCFGVITTLFSSHYPLFKFCQTFQKRKIANVILSIFSFAISLLGFYNIVNFIYPLLGFIGFIYIGVISILSIFSR